MNRGLKNMWHFILIFLGCFWWRRWSWGKGRSCKIFFLLIGDIRLWKFWKKIRFLFLTLFPLSQRQSGFSLYLDWWFPVLKEGKVVGRCSFKLLQNSLRDGEFFHGLTRRHSSCSYSPTEGVGIQSSRKTVSLYGQGTVACKYDREHPISPDKLWRNDAHLQRVRPPGLQDKDRAHCLCAELQASCLITMMSWAGMIRPDMEMCALVFLRSARSFLWSSLTTLQEQRKHLLIFTWTYRVGKK